MAHTIAPLPADQVPAVFVYQDNNQTIRIVHHIHRVESPLGQPANPLTNLILGFTGEVQHKSPVLNDSTNAMVRACCADWPIYIPT